MVHLDLSYMQMLAQQRDGKCLSKKYIDAYAPLKWMCDKGHTWDAGYYLIQQGFWCVQCAKEERRKEQLEKLVAYATERGGKCLTKKFINHNTNIKFQCVKGHKFDALISNLKQRSYWCKYCNKEKSDNDYLQHAKKHAASKGGKCMSDYYTSRKSILTWQCAAGHTWKANASHIINDHSWCPFCSGKATHPLEDLQKAAARHNGFCLSTKAIGGSKKHKWQCEKGHVWQAVVSKIVNENQWCPVCRYTTVAAKLKGDIKEYQLLAKSKGGKLLSKEYVNALTKMEWQCKQGHKWLAQPASIKYGSWCPQCGGRFPLNIQMMQSIAVAKGGKCLSETYVNVSTPLQWQCSKGHIWSTKPIVIRRGNWCPICAGKKGIKSYQQKTFI